MRVRDRRIVVLRATSPFGAACVEALLALGAHVLAAARLRTELESLRGALRHHERLNVAECAGDDSDGLRALLRSWKRGGPIDGIVLAGTGADDAAARDTLRALLDDAPELAPARLLFGTPHAHEAPPLPSVDPRAPRWVVFDPASPAASPPLTEALELLSSREPA